MLRERADAALKLAERARTAMGGQKIDEARWLAAGAVREAEAVRKGATARGANDAARVARDARAKARAVLRLAVSQRLAAARKLEALRRGPPPARVVAQPVPGSIVPMAGDKDASGLHLIAAEAMGLARQARKLFDGGQSNAARWLAVAALQKAEMAHKRATARGAETVVVQAGNAKRLAEDVARLAASHRLASERQIADARIGPPPLSAAAAKRIATALTQTKAGSSRKANDRAKTTTRLAAVAPAQRSRRRTASRVKTSIRTRSGTRRSAKRAARKSTKRRGRRVARASVKKWVGRSAKRKAKRRSRFRRSRRRQRYVRARWYVVRRGDSLWRIARRFLGRGERYWAIVRVNRGRVDLRNPNLIYPKQRLRIPRLRG
jgi:nucleoid-associated protein YgaU